MKLLNKPNIMLNFGNILEWYDFCLYGYFASVFATFFFPAHHIYISLMLVFLTFAIGGVMRPIGGLLFGYWAEHYGGGRALSWSVWLMGIPTFCIGLLPSYQQVGFLAPLLLLIIRLLQGLSTGGQYSNALTLLRMRNPEKHGALVTNFAYIASVFGFLLASLVGMLSLKLVHHSWAWRIPFLVTALFFPGLLTMAKHLVRDDHKERLPVVNKRIKLLQLWMNRKVLLRGIVLASIGGIFYFSFYIFLISYLKIHVGLMLDKILLINMICLIASCFTCLVFAVLADRYGRKPVMLVGIAAILVLLYPSFVLLNTGAFSKALLGFWLLTASDSIFFAAVAVVYVELFPKEIRFTACAISYNVGAGIAGGVTPAVLALLLHYHSFMALFYLLVLVAALAFLFVWFFIWETKEISSAGAR